jgi:hypothetical protein
MSDLRFTPLAFQFSSTSQLGASKGNNLCSWFRLGEIESSFKEFHASQAMMCFGVDVN